jgi:hypothetical protein
MATIGDMVNDAEWMLHHASANQIALPPGTAAVLLAAKGNEAALAAPGKSRDDFFAAFAAAAAALGGPLAELRAAALRCARVAPMLGGALQLLEFAAAHARPVEDEVRNPILAAAEALARGSLTLAQEQALMKAYQALTIKTAPVNADTLEASRTKLPDLAILFSREGFADGLKGLTLGRFFNALLFVLVLIGTCVSLAYYSLGSTSLSRYRELHASLAKAEAELPQKKDIVALREAALRKEEAKPKPDDDALAAARRNLAEAQRVVAADEAGVKEGRAEESTIPDRLWRWSQQPCEATATFVFRWALCSTIDKLAPGAEAPGTTARIEAARTVSARLSDIYLPLLLGWLGAFAFILRKMTKEIGEHAFGKSSALQHIVRLGLGALAGFASTWLLTPEVVGGEALKKIPAWALAFIAGYGIELVFAFMDRIINAFTSRSG